jgi:3'(2'), 5'-bisphosphate nucleotidase
MRFRSHASLTAAILPAVIEAARVILATRRAGLVVESKTDNSPVTEADRRAEQILTQALHAIHPAIPVVGEETVSAGAAPAIGDTFFLLDPLDGTRDYAAGRDDFTINIGLIDSGHPTFGLIYAPARHDLFVTNAPGKAVTARFDPERAAPTLAELNLKPLQVRHSPSTEVSALISRRESGPDFDGRLAALGVTHRIVASSALKFGLLARGDADIYPRFGPTCEWDTAAGQAIVEAAGGTVTALDGTPLIYGKVADKFLNGPFVARARRPAMSV